MIELKTVSRKNPEFQSYLMGTFSKTYRAIPVESLNITTESETVTFKIIPLNEVQTPNLIQKWATILKLNQFIFVLLPLFLILAKCSLDQVAYDPLLALLSGFGAFALHASVQLRHDLIDHVSGLDRVSQQNSQRPIQKGWIAADQVRKLSIFFMCLSFVLGFPAIYFYPEIIAIILVLLLFGFIGIQSNRFGLKYRLWTEVTAFLFLGPFLTVGYQIGIGAGYDIEALFLGMITGLISVFVLHVKNFQQIMVQDQFGFLNSITILGFEKAKTFLLLWWLGIISILNLYHFLYSPFDWQIVFFIVSCVLTFIVYRAITKLNGPLNSYFQKILANLYRTVIVLITVWVLELVVLIVAVEIAQS